MSDEPSPPLRLKPRNPAPPPPAGVGEESAAPGVSDPSPRPARPVLRIVDRPAPEPGTGAADANAAEPATLPAAVGDQPEPPRAAVDDPSAATPTEASDAGRVTVSADSDPSAGGPPVLHIGLKGDAEPEVPLERPPSMVSEPSSETPPPLPIPGHIPLMTAHPPGVSTTVGAPPAAAPQRRRAFKLGVYAVVLLTLALVGVGATFFFRAVKRATDAKRNQVRAEPGPAPVATPIPGPTPTTSGGPGVVAGAIAKAAVEVRKAEARAETVEGILAPTTPRRPAPEEDLSRFPPPTGRPVSAEAGASRAFVAFVESVRISGVFEGNPARALINGRTVRAGGLVDAPLGVVFVGLDAANRQVIFRDAAGVFVRKPY